MCVGYRQLNDLTVKDKYTILVIEELIDNYMEQLSSLNSIVGRVTIRFGYVRKIPIKPHFA